MHLAREISKVGASLAAHPRLEGLVASDNVLERGRAEEVFLLQTQLLPLHFLQQTQTATGCEVRVNWRVTAGERGLTLSFG